MRSRSNKAGESLPEKFDLWDVDVVTPVKLQNPFGTCWGLATIAAVETSLLSEYRLTTGEAMDPSFCLLISENRKTGSAGKPP